jgi:hypothetical protein
MNRQKINSLLNKSSFWQILAVLLLFASFLCLFILFLNPVSAQNEGLKTLSLNVKSDLQANYQVDARQGFLPNISLMLVKEMISNNTANGDAEPEFQAFMQSLDTLVPTVTPDPNIILLITNTPEPTSSLTLTQTITPTLSVTVTETETATVTPTESATPWIVTLTWTPWPDEPRVNPPQPKPPATDTAIPPTITVAPPATPTPTLTLPPPPTDTNTPLPPTATPTESPETGPPVGVPPPRNPTATSAPAATATLAPAATATSSDAPRGKPDTKTPKPSKTPKPDKRGDTLSLPVPMLAEPVIIEWSSSQD